MSFLLMLDFIACTDGSVDPSRATEDNSNDSAGSAPSAIDTVQHPNGMTNGSVISRDTAAMATPDSVPQR